MTDKNKKTEAPVMFIPDPFELPHDGIITAQGNPDELDLDQELEDQVELAIPDNDVLIDKLAGSLAKEHERTVNELEATLRDDEKAMQEELARDIAEDEAIEKARLNPDHDDESLALDPALQEALPKVTADGNLDLCELQSCIECLLFIADKPMSLKKLQDLLGPGSKPALFREAVEGLRTRYQEIHHGFELVDVGGGLQFRTKPGRAALAKLLAKVQTQRLSRGAMETLAITAYKQPVMKEDIDGIRGVDSSHFIRTLLDRKLIQISGRSELPGRPMLYTTTQTFLELFGLNDLQSMPPLRELEQMIPTSQVGADEEDPRLREMRRMIEKMGTETHGLAYDPREDENILKDIKERVKGIPTTTPFLEQQDAEKDAAREAEPPITDLVPPHGT